MGLREQAAADSRAFLEDAAGFSWPVTVTAPSGTSAALHGFTTDISQTIDPDTGQLVMGREASVALPIEALVDAGLGLPRGISDGSGKPWLVAFSDVNGNAYAFKVREAMPDRAIGVVVCRLEAYKP